MKTTQTQSRVAPNKSRAHTTSAQPERPAGADARQERANHITFIVMMSILAVALVYFLVMLIFL